MKRLAAILFAVLLWLPTPAFAQEIEQGDVFENLARLDDQIDQLIDILGEALYYEILDLLTDSTRNMDLLLEELLRQREADRKRRQPLGDSTET